MNQKEYERRIDAVAVCGKNRGPHDYIPISWLRTETSEHVTKLMCRICFNQVGIQTLMHEYPDVSINYA